MDEADETITGTTIENLALPSPFDQRAYDKAVELDEILASGPLDRARLEPAVRDYTGAARDHLRELTFRPAFPIFPWPSSWYIPGTANYQDYWPLPPPTENRYDYQWISETTVTTTASSATGDLGVFKQLLSPNDRYTAANSGIGFLYTPTFSYGVVTLRPKVDCAGDFRWWQTLQPLAGYTHTTTDLFLGMWVVDEGAWDLVDFKTIQVADGFPQSGEGMGAIFPYQRSFTGAELATDFTVMTGHEYLFGVVARVNIWSTLTTTTGGRIPEPPDLSNFRIWGTIACRVPLIELDTKTVYTP